MKQVKVYFSVPEYFPTISMKLYMNNIPKFVELKNYELVLEENERKDKGDKEICEKLFLKLQNTDTLWSDNNKRSISVGDLICIDNKYFICAPMGWREVKISTEDVKET